ncbi:MAG TPA: chloride channel protein [Verrucomicrobiae bacterium]|nr:chloride channel protein [Verrucomicrobiae bacterium]
MKSNIVARLAQKWPGQGRPIFLTCLYGLSAGGVAVAFQWSMNLFYSQTLLRFSGHARGAFLLESFVLLVGTSAAVGFLLNHYCREASGSGIPQLKLAFWKDFGYVPWRVVWVKFLAGVISIGGGSSLGREGPSVQLGGALSSNVAGWLGAAKQNRRRAALAGAAAGLAAAFNTPLAAITFTLEEIIEDLNSRFLGSVLLASVIGAFVVHGLVGKQPAFSLKEVEAPGWPVYVLTPVVAAAAALAGVIFQKVTLDLRQRRKGFERVPPWLRPVIGAVVTWAVGSAVFLNTGHLGVFGLGYVDLSAGLNQDLGWQLAGLLLVTKLVATCACYGFGGCGGVFSPMLFLGGMCGLFLAGLSGLAMDLHPADHVVLAVVGMSGCLGAVVGAPVTGILIVFEMTHQFSLVPALMLGALVSQAVGRRLTPSNFYEALLLQDGHDLQHVIPPRDLQSWLQLPVSAIANFHPVIAPGVAPEALATLLRDHPQQRFPVVMQDTLAGILTRREAELALAEKRTPKLDKAVVCQPQRTIGELQSLLIESASLLVVVVDAQERILGLVTLHDLLRAETALAKGNE